MPRIRQYADKYAKGDFLKEIDARCVWAGFRTNEALGNAIGVTGNTVGNFKKDPGRIRMDVMQKMVKILKLDPGVVLLFLGYTSKDIRKFAKGYLHE